MFTGCGEKIEFPSEFVGRWEFDADSAKAYIEAMDLPEGDIIKLSGSFPHMNRGIKMRVTENGTWTYDDAPADLKITLKVIERREDWHVFESTNVLNPSEKQYSQDRVKNGIWEAISLGGDLVEIPEHPRTYWKPLN